MYSVQTCPANTFMSNSKNVVQMCGSMFTESCTVTMSSYNSGTNYKASDAVDLDLNSQARSSQDVSSLIANPHWLRVVLQQIRVISSVTMRVAETNLNLGQFRMGNMPLRASNPVIETISFYQNQFSHMFDPPQQAQYIFFNYELKDIDHQQKFTKFLTISDVKAFSLCDNCPLFSTSLASSTSITQCQCIRGYEMKIDNTCFPCPPGSYELNGLCTLCEAKKYNPNSAQFACQNCPTNSLSSVGSIANTSCLCDEGFTGTSVCIACESGTYKNNLGSAACESCQVNSVPSTQSSSCLCNAGYTGTHECTLCESNTYKSSTGNATCTVCPGLETSSTGSTNRSMCTPLPTHQIALCAHLANATAHVLALDAEQHSVANLQETGCVHIDPCTQVTRAGLPAAANEWHHVADLGLTSSEDGTGAHYNHTPSSTRACRRA